MVIYIFYEPPRISCIIGYVYNHSDGVNFTVGNPEYLEPLGILENRRPQVFCVRSGLNQSYSS